MSEKKKSAAEKEERERRLERQKRRVLAQTRRRENMLTSLNIAVIIGIFAFGALFMTFGERPNESVEENRDLAKCPTFSFESYFKGDFTKEFAEFYNDTVPLRSTFKSMISAFRANLGIKYGGGVSISGGLPTIETRPDRPATSSSSSKTTPVVVIPQQTGTSSASSTSSSSAMASTSASAATSSEPVDYDPNGGMMSGTVFVLNDGRAFDLAAGSYSGGERYAETLNEYKRTLGENVNVYSLVSPTSMAFYLPDEYSGISGDQEDVIDYLNGFLDGVIPIDAYSVFERHTSEDIFMRTDHHWSSLGAYYAAEEFARMARVDFAELNEENYEEVSREGYIGTLYGYSGENQLIRDNPETFTYYKPRNDFTADFYTQTLEYSHTGELMRDIDGLDTVSWYLVNLGGDAYAVDVNTDCHNGRRLVIVKDSYGNALPAFLTSSFEEIWVVDMRYFERSVTELCANEGITDVLFAMNPSSATGVNQENLVNIM
ncbi:MAG: DHHW family protein [Lachnospiraceae bacterium]|nr:DHHW family protein [Ruminococcus sp.]MCM1273864.1 DHHW family protein [Lachnospiraceae bacterium]